MQEKDLALQVYFSADWARMVETAFRNFLTEAMLALPLPTLLRFDADREKRQTLLKQVSQQQVWLSD